ncbi:hypothetical protein [Dyadobacter luticola]|uniref:Uncharacterized protein n=1 Tax=Dyadobacter luticola TaxID=1979387 RepID=A0A5R9L5S2_9BACT|nr:hypothetical protein [Dyadobacter luticola]TLV03922.1 hypothetical protein FEN17_10150 [Dyadobacter luticola]
MQIIRNDTVIERLTSYGSKNWIGKRKYGKVLFGGLSKQGRKSFIIEILDPKNFLSGDVILGTIMQGDYDEKLDTTQTFYSSPP